ncbi:MAG TPA: 4Fe-4S dicluster domain-containing protein [Nitrospirota bacterium]|nr:4Fe-4S dicluster domain-containing protein [Nitrospirota bacterium]
MKMLLPVIDPDLCTSCGLCVAACPYEVLEMINGLAVVTKPKACKDVEACVKVCPTGAVSMEEVEVED